MDMRRLVLVMVMGLVVLTLLASLSVPEEDTDEPPAETRSGAVETPQPFALRHPAPARPPVKRVRVGLRVIVRVSSSVAGQAEVTGLGLLQAVDPGVPIEFDVLATRPGRYDVTLAPLEGAKRRLGTLVVD